MAKRTRKPNAEAHDPVFQAIERHQEARRLFKNALAVFVKCDDTDKWDWENAPQGKGRADWVMKKQAKNKPRKIAYEAFNNASKVVIRVTKQLVATRPTTTAGIAAVLQYWAKFYQAGVCDGGHFEFLDPECSVKLMNGLAETVRAHAHG